MKWKEILKVDLQEARMLGRKHAPEEMSAGKEKITVEKNIMSFFTDETKHTAPARNTKQGLMNFHYRIRSGKVSGKILISMFNAANNVFNYEDEIMNYVTFHSVDVKPDEGVITVKYSSPENENETFSFNLTRDGPMRTERKI